MSGFEATGFEARILELFRIDEEVLAMTPTPPETSKSMSSSSTREGSGTAPNEFIPLPVKDRAGRLSFLLQ